LDKCFEYEVAKTNILNGFGSSLIDALNDRRDRLDQFLNGLLLFNQEQLLKVEDIVLETRHLEYIWKQVSQY